MSKPTWFDSYCEKINSLWRRQFGDEHVYIYNLREHYDSIIFTPGNSGRVQYEGTFYSPKIALENKAKILHSRYDVASSVLLEHLNNLGREKHFPGSRAYTEFRCAIESLSEYFFQSDICSRDELKILLKNDISFDTTGDYSAKNIMKALDNGLYAYMKGIYDSWIKKKEKEFTSSMKDGFKIKRRKIHTEIKTTEHPFSGLTPVESLYNNNTGQRIYISRREIESDDNLHLSNTHLAIAFDKAAINENEINKLLKDVAKFDCSKPIIFTQRYGRMEHAAATSAINYLENLGVIGKGEVEVKVRHGLTAALKGSVDKWLETETIRNINDLYE
jgi:hypothetical protein